MTAFAGGLHFALASLLVAWGLIGGCQKFDICGSESLPCELAGGAGGGEVAQPESAAAGGGEVAKPESTAGSPASSDAGVGGAGELECMDPFAECDGSSLTSCETDTSRSPLHCGSCQQVCAGVCAGNECHPFSLVSGGAYNPSESLAINKNFVFFAAKPAAGSTRTDLLRERRETGEVDVILSQAFQEVEQLLIVGPRLYLLADSAVWSVDSSGADLREEAFDADQLTTFRSELYFADSDSVYRWTEPSATLIVNMSPGSAMIAGDAELLVIGSNDEVEGQRTYAVYDRAARESSSELLEESLGQLHAVAVMDGNAYWIVDPGGELPLQLRGAASDASIELGPASELEGVAIADDLVVVAETRRQRHWLRLIPFAAPEEARELETTGALRGLQYWEKQLWFYDTRQLALVRISPLSLYELAG